MACFRQTVLTALLLLSTAPLLLAQDPELDLTQPYLLLATSKTSTMQRELDEASAAGYRVLMGSRTSGGELLATTKASTLQNELNNAAGEGFRLLWQTVAGKRGTKGGILGRLATGMAGSPGSLNSDEVVGVMEKMTAFENRYEYLVLDTVRTRTMQAEIARAVQDGYVPAAIMSSPSGENYNPLVPVAANLIVILEKAIPRTGEVIQ